MNMRFLSALCLLACATGAQAGLYTDDMSRCLVASTSQQDKTDLVRWIFAGVALHPKVADIVNVTPAARDEMNRGTARLFQRLIADSCRKQTQVAMRYEGSSAMEQSFRVLGEVAMQELTSDAKVAAGFGDFVKYMDMDKIKALAEQ